MEGGVDGAAPLAAHDGSHLQFLPSDSEWPLPVAVLSGFLWPLRDDTIHRSEIRAACVAFLEGYRTVRPLLPEEDTAVAASVKARDFWETGCWLKFGVNLDRHIDRTSLHSLANQFRRFPISRYYIGLSTTQECFGQAPIPRSAKAQGSRARSASRRMRDPVGRAVPQAAGN